MPVREITTEIPDRDRNSEDRTDESMRWWCRDTEVPRPEIPDDRSDEEWEDDTDSISEWRRGNSLEWEEVYYSHSNRDPTDENPEGIHAGREDHGVLSLQSIGIDNWCHSIGCIVKSIDELKCTNEKETEPERDIDDFHRKIIIWLIYSTIFFSKKANISYFSLLFFSTFLFLMRRDRICTEQGIWDSFDFLREKNRIVASC
jgi:hypothetical protein